LFTEKAEKNAEKTKKRWWFRFR